MSLRITTYFFISIPLKILRILVIVTSHFSLPLLTLACRNHVSNSLDDVKNRGLPGLAQVLQSAERVLVLRVLRGADHDPLEFALLLERAQQVAHVLDQGRRERQQPEAHSGLVEGLRVALEELGRAEHHQVVEDPVEEEAEARDQIQRQIDLIVVLLVQQLRDCVVLIYALEETEQLPGVAHAD